MAPIDQTDKRAIKTVRTLLVVATEPPLDPTNKHPIAITAPNELPPVPTMGARQSLAAVKVCLFPVRASDERPMAHGVRRIAGIATLGRRCG